MEDSSLETIREQEAGPLLPGKILRFPNGETWLVEDVIRHQPIPQANKGTFSDQPIYDTLNG